MPLHLAENHSQRRVHLLVRRGKFLRLYFASQERDESLQLIGPFSRSTGKRRIQVAKHHRWKVMLRRGGSRQIRIEHGGVANPGNRVRRVGRVRWSQELKKLWIMDYFRTLGIR